MDTRTKVGMMLLAGLLLGPGPYLTEREQGMKHPPQRERREPAAETPIGEESATGKDPAAPNGAR